MKTSHEAQVEIRELLPDVQVINEKLLRLFCETVGPTGPQGIQGPISDINGTYQYLYGSVNYIKSIAEYFRLPLADRSDPAVAKLKTLERALVILSEDPKKLTPDGLIVVQEILDAIRA